MKNLVKFAEHSFFRNTGMKKIKLLLAVAVLCLATSAFAQNDKEPSIEEIIANQIEAFDKLLHLDDIQLFYMDSILQVNLPSMQAELESVKNSGAALSESYLVVSDKWNDETDNAIKKILTEEQWKKLMKSPYGREKEKREKRMKDRTK